MRFLARFSRTAGSQRSSGRSRGNSRRVAAIGALGGLVLSGLVSVPALAHSATPSILAAPPATETAYDSTPHPVPGNVASLGYQANQTAEFGDEVNLAGTLRR